MKTTLTLLAMLACGISAQAGWTHMNFLGMDDDEDEQGFRDRLHRIYQEDFIASDDDAEGFYGESDDDDNQQPGSNNNNNEEEESDEASGNNMNPNPGPSWGKVFDESSNRDEGLLKAWFNAATEGNFAEIEDTLIRHDINVDIRNEHGYTALHLAAEAGHLNVVQCLIDRDAEVNATTDVDPTEDPLNTALHLAVGAGHLDIVERLLNNGAGVDLENGDDGSPLHLAALEGHFDIAQLLIDHDADINLQNGLGYTALHVAVMNNHPETVALLLDRGADPDIENEDGETAMDLTNLEDDKISQLITNNEEVIKLLEEKANAEKK